MAEQELRGSCLCGVVRFRVEGAFESFYLCHCSRCRKGTGSAHAANLFSGAAKLVWDSGEDAVQVFRLPESQHSRSFCRSCGSALPTAQSGGARVMVPAGSLDDEVEQEPTAHIFLASRARWEDRLAAAPGFGALPE